MYTKNGTNTIKHFKGTVLVYIHSILSAIHQCNGINDSFRKKELQMYICLTKFDKQIYTVIRYLFKYE